MGPIFRVFLTSFLFFLSTNSQSEYRVPDPPENVRIKTTSTTATLWWDPPFSASNILVRGYTISYGIDTPGNKIVIEGVQTNVFTIEGLKPNTKYVFSVTAYNEAEEEDSEKIFLTAKTESNQNIVENHFRLQSPNDVKILPLSPNDVEIIWFDPVSETSSENTVDYATKRRFYIVQYSLMGSENSEKKLTTEKNQILLTNLDENKDYEIAIRTVFPDGRESPWSSRKYFRTPSSSTREMAFFMDKEKTENEEICDFETANICDYFSDSTAPIQFYRQTSIEGFKDRNGGHFLTIEASKQPNDKFGRLLSPVWSFHKDSFCLMLWTLIRADSTGTLTISILYEGDSMNMAIPIYKSKLEKMQKETWIEFVVESKIRRKKSFQLIIEVRKQILKGKFLVSVDDIKAKSGTCLDRKNPFQKSISDEETDVDLLTPLENLINTDPRVYRTKGLDGLPAVGIQRGVEIVVPYRIYLPKKFYKNFAIVASIKPKDNQGGYLFAVVNAFDTVVDLGLLLAPAGRDQTNISLIYTNNQIQSHSTIIASFLVPTFTNQWTQISLEVVGDSVALYFRCMRFATRQIHRQPEQLQMDDASKLYIANAGPILGGGFEGDEASGFEQTFDSSKSTPQNDERDDNQLEDDDRGRTPNIGQQPRTTPKPFTQRFQTTTDSSPKPEYVRGPKGDKGDPGEPGVCPTNCQSYFAYSQAPSRLSDEDIARIANYPGVKGAKGDNYAGTGPTTLPPYDSHVHKYTLKGEKGEKGDQGPMGPPGQPGTIYHSSGSSSSKGLVAIYETSTLLFASSQNTEIGQLAFSKSSQQLYIRVNNGWKEVKLENFHSMVEQRPPVPITNENLSSKVDHLAYWLNDEASVSIHGNSHGPCVRRSLSQSSVTAKTVYENPPPTYYEPKVIIETEPEIQTLAPPPQVVEQQQSKLDVHRPRIHHHDKIIHLIALNRSINGNMRGIRGADLMCYQQARQAGFRTTFRAFVSSRVQDLVRIVHHADRDTPIVNFRGEKLFDDWASVFERTSMPNNVPIYSFNHRNVLENDEWPDKYIWHGSDDEGLRVDNVYCEDWRSTSSYSHGMASALLRGRSLLTNGEKISCQRELIVLCVENMSKFNVDRLLRRRQKV